jgi:hypothetical protein
MSREKSKNHEKKTYKVRWEVAQKWRRLAVVAHYYCCHGHKILGSLSISETRKK